MGDSSPKYTVHVAAKRTGIPAATLRAWEKRYGVPTPSRTESRYRLYSDLDLAQLTWMKGWVCEGIPPRQAAQLVRERRESGVAFVSPAGLAAAELVSDFKAACLAYDEDRAQIIIQRAGASMGPIEIMRGVLFSAIAEIGRDWEHGLVTVAQEHFASQMTRRFALRLMDVYQKRPGLRPVLCGCAPGEHHELGLLAVTAELRSRGLPVVYLGVDVPVDAVLSTVESVRAQVALIGVTLPENLEPWIACARTGGLAAALRISSFLWGGPGAAVAVEENLPGQIALTIEQAVTAGVAVFSGKIEPLGQAPLAPATP